MLLHGFLGRKTKKLWLHTHKHTSVDTLHIKVKIELGYCTVGHPTWLSFIGKNEKYILSVFRAIFKIMKIIPFLVLKKTLFSYCEN